MSANVTLFQSDSSSASTGNAFDQSAFQDISLPATNNTGLTSTASSNPLGGNFANDDGARYAVKTLYIKDLVLVSDHALWVSGKPTYQIIWNENYPEAQGYIFGDIQTYKGKSILIRQIGDGIGVTGVFRKCAFIVTGDTASAATGQLSVDGANTSTIDFSNSPNALLDGAPFAASGVASPLVDNKYNIYVNSASNQSIDIHDYRLTALQTSTLRILGVVVYSENTSKNIDLFPGTTYVNKAQATTSTGATLALPSYTGALGGCAVIYKNASGAYLSATNPAPNIQSIATGSTGTNLVSVSVGTGASFPTGSGIAAFWGSTGFIGSVTNQSTDTLTVSPTLPFGISGLIYKTWAAGVSLPINSSLMVLSRTFDFNQVSTGFSNYFADPTGLFRIWGNALGSSTVDGIWPSLVGLNVTTGFIQVDGYFSAADIEFSGQGKLHATLSVNGYPAFGLNTGITGTVKNTVFTDAGPGWNSFNLTWGASLGPVGINRINLYQRQIPSGVSYGLLAQMDTLVNFVNPTAVNATYIAQGTYRRHYGDQLGFKGGWDRRVDTTGAGGVAYTGASTNSALNFQYYGKNFAVLGINSGQSMALALDGGAASGFRFNVVQSVATEMFHSVAITNGGSTAIIHAIDVFRTQGEIKNIQTYAPIPIPKQSSVSELYVQGGGGFGSAGANIRYFPTITVYTGTSITYAQSTVFGDSFIINDDGVYSIYYADCFSGAALSGISLNSSQLSTALSSLPESNVLAATTLFNANDPVPASVTASFRAGDVIRVHVDNVAGIGSAPTLIGFRIIRIK